MPRRECPLDAGDGPLLQFARDLRLLREKVGCPSYRELAARAHVSASALSGAASGRKLPSLMVTLAFVRACEGDVGEWERRWRELVSELATPVVDVEDTGDAPYVGLSAFRVEDADRFFGRQRLVEQLVRRLLQGRFVGVVGASGAGKTSLLRAGLLPAVRTETLVDGCSWPTVMMTPGPRPLEECAIHLARLTGHTPGQMNDELATEPRALHRLVRQALADHPDPVELVFVVDQFEELFTLCQEPRERAQFLDALLTAATAQASRLRVVVGIRADFYAHCSRYRPLDE
ncbi:hypothetical protein GCM10012275_34940 [Longimycelium tulufanense]|uniref:HTH cro/C1-type domain-containing protein n=1 Tax=Longimycelium tulufanense TaxID=907463 RepID=A0A8J3FUQ4_9PSEU|nr:helix-turn-helix domain-containing protein [Longimycelium tulufanense]GGM60906.1 hypothetical protein GCM10012275_34940 [Longimycelium tulufanense]